MQLLLFIKFSTISKNVKNIIFVWPHPPGVGGVGIILLLTVTKYLIKNFNAIIAVHQILNNIQKCQKIIFLDGPTPRGKVRRCRKLVDNIATDCVQICG
jgi:hypothetical protein